MTSGEKAGTSELDDTVRERRVGDVPGLASAPPAPPSLVAPPSGETTPPPTTGQMVWREQTVAPFPVDAVSGEQPDAYQASTAAAAAKERGFIASVVGGAARPRFSGSSSRGDGSSEGARPPSRLVGKAELEELGVATDGGRHGPRLGPGELPE